jgi:hypothetical protein
MELRQNREMTRGWPWPCFFVLVACPASLLCAQAQELARQGDPLPSQSQSPSGQTEAAPKPKPDGKSERIFGIVPAYTITDARNAPALKPSEKFKLFYQTSLDPFPIGAYAVQAGISQATDTHNGYGQGAAGYGKRFGAALADGTSARFFGTYAFPSLLRQDPRYFRKGQGGGWSRCGYAVSRGFVTQGDSGRTQPNWSNLLGKLAGGALSNVYYPTEDRGAQLTFSRVALSLGYQTFGNLAIEFWPEIRRMVSKAGNNTSVEGGTKP